MIEEAAVEEETPVPSLADDLGAAWDELEETDDGDGDINAQQTEGADLDTTPEPDNDSEGVPETEEQSEGKDEAQSPAVDDAPSSLPPAAREAWKDAPKALKDAVAKRERDYEAGIMKYAEGAKRSEGMDHALRPYSQYIQMNGGPAQALQGLLQTGSILQMGTPQQKAQTVAKLISDFGIDIQALDSMLVGNAPPANPQADVQSQVQAALAQRDQQMYAQQQQVAQQQAGQTIEQFRNDPKNEFYNDVWQDMATLLDMAGARNENLSIEAAYDQACRYHPEVSKIIASRQNGQNVQQKRKAASSIHGTQNGPSGTPEPSSLRGAIEAAWDSAGQM